MADGGFYGISLAQKSTDGAGLGGRFNNNHLALALLPLLGSGLDFRGLKAFVRLGAPHSIQL